MKKPLALAFLLAVPVHAQDRADVGMVMSVQGRAEIVWPDGRRIQAQREEEVLEADTLETGPDGFILVRFADGAIVSLGCNSSLKIEQYKTDDQEVIEMHLVRGRIRTITGSTTPENYRLRVTPANATIRLTTPEADFVVVEEPQDGLVSGAYSGGIEVNNNLGSLPLGAGAEFDFSRLESGQPPTGAPIMPTSLQPNSSCT